MEFTMIEKKPSWMRWKWAITLPAVLAAVAAISAHLVNADTAKNTPGTDGVMHGLRATTLDGRIVPLGSAATRPTTVIFLGTECPISRWYISTLNDLAITAAKQGQEFYGVISDPTVSRADAVKFSNDYLVHFPLVFDASGELAAELSPKVTPEAFVMDRTGHTIYRGRIDDAYSGVTKQAQHVDHHDLLDAMSAVDAGTTPAAAETTAIGCVFEAWTHKPAGGSVTYARDIAPILMASCVSCHHEGAIGPFPLQTYEDASKHAKQIAAVTEGRIMPPWKAAEGFCHFVDERRLSDREIATIRDWADAGAPRGSDADLPPVPAFATDWQLGQPDLILTLPKPFDVPASGRDVYRAYVLPTNITEDRFVASVEFHPGAPTVVHHALYFLDNEGAARKLQNANQDGQPGYQSFGGVGFRATGGLGGWAPGATPYLLPDGKGRLLQKNSDFVLQVHYHPDGKPRHDQDQIGIYFAKKPVTERIVGFPLANRRIDIAPNDNHYTREIHVTTPVDLTLVGVTPHMHLLGHEMKATATEPDGAVVPLIWIQDWDFRWQDQYRYAQPIHLPRGTKIDVIATYDNSDANPANPSSPPQCVRFGEQTTDEMCFCFLQLEIPVRRGSGIGLLQLLRTADPEAANRGN